MKKRVALARTIALMPEVLLYDEPTTGLDPPNAARISQLIYEINKKLRVTSIVVTHDMHTAFAVSDRMAMLRDGHVVLHRRSFNAVRTATSTASSTANQHRKRGPSWPIDSPTAATRCSGAARSRSRSR
jgi:ABC-type transporter Mla maintaining outer membrane lipid asymmetry ATPase subunit MlaF